MPFPSDEANYLDGAYGHSGFASWYRSAEVSSLRLLTDVCIRYRHLPHPKVLTVNELFGCRSFEWDEGNSEKIWIKHRVARVGCEEVFFNRPLVVADDVKHSELERRYYALGHTDAGRRPFLVFTIRGDRIRVISARPMSRRERRIYDRAKEEDTPV